MLPRIQSVQPLPDLILTVIFDDGVAVLYDVKEDLHLPGYQSLQADPRLFESVRLDSSRTCIFWSDDIDLPSDVIYEYGQRLPELSQN